MPFFGRGVYNRMAVLLCCVLLLFAWLNLISSPVLSGVVLLLLLLFVWLNLISSPVFSGVALSRLS